MLLTEFKYNLKKRSGDMDLAAKLLICLPRSKARYTCVFEKKKKNILLKSKNPLKIFTIISVQICY